MPAVPAAASTPELSTAAPAVPALRRGAGGPALRRRHGGRVPGAAPAPTIAQPSDTSAAVAAEARREQQQPAAV